jgi:hypothetical protein
MSLLISSLGSLVVALIFYAHRDYVGQVCRRRRALRGRVTYMLWKAAMQLH